MRRWIVIPLVPMLVACSGPAATQVAPAPAPTSQVAAATPASAAAAA